MNLRKLKNKTSLPAFDTGEARILLLCSDPKSSFYIFLLKKDSKARSLGLLVDCKLALIFAGNSLVITCLRIDLFQQSGKN